MCREKGHLGKPTPYQNPPQKGWRKWVVYFWADSHSWFWPLIWNLGCVTRFGIVLWRQEYHQDNTLLFKKWGVINLASALPTGESQKTYLFESMEPIQHHPRLSLVQPWYTLLFPNATLLPTPCFPSPVQPQVDRIFPQVGMYWNKKSKPSPSYNLSKDLRISSLK